MHDGLSFESSLFMSALVESDIEASVIGGRYVIDRKLGSGGEGAVYLAYDQLLNRHVAIKSIHTGADALGAAHSLGMAHRDIKSANIMVTWTESGDLRVKLLDFGVAKVMTSPSEQMLVRSGALTGSIYFLSPAQPPCQPIEHRTDFYSLGCVFYRALTLRNPFEGSGVPAEISSNLQRDFIPLADYRPDLPSELTDWVERLFSFSPDERPPSAAAALADLERLINKQSVQSAPRAKSAYAPAAVSKKPARHFSVWLAAVAAILAVSGIFAALIFTDQGKKKSTPAEAEEERERFNAGERTAIARRNGKTATVAGEIADFREEGSKRFLIFKGAESGDVALYFMNSEKGDFSTRLLKTFVGARVTATGIVSKDEKRLLLEVPNMSQLRRQVHQEPSNKPASP